jgi:hypothetical protein
MDIISEAAHTLTCPKCGSTLVLGIAPFYVRGEYLGNFESVICKNSHFSALTESGLRDASTIAERRGLIGPVEEVYDDEDEGVRVLLTRKLKKFEIAPNHLYHH